MKFAVSHAGDRGITAEHTAVNLSIYLQECLDQWNLQSTQVSKAVTDNASNITAAVGKMERVQKGHIFNRSIQGFWSSKKTCWIFSFLSQIY